MSARALYFAAGRPAVPLDSWMEEVDAGWVWIDVDASAMDIDDLLEMTARLGLDPLAVRDAIDDLDHPKVDDFGSSLLVVLHALGEERIETIELDCFLTNGHLVTVRLRDLPSIDLLWEGVQQRPELADGGPDELLARLADVVTRRLLSVLDVFDARVDDLVRLALNADGRFLGEITAVRADLAVLRAAIHPQREALDEMRRSMSTLVSDAGRRWFADVFDAATRASAGVDAARSALAETLDAYRGAEAKQATEVSKVLTVYAAIMLPLSLVVGFFGMNFENLPLVDDDDGWIWVSVAMGLITLVSLGMFVSLGWIRRPSGRTAGALLGRGLVEAARTPAQLVGAAFEISSMPVRSVAGSVMQRLNTSDHDEPDVHDDGSQRDPRD